MRIKKVSETTPVQAQIVDGYSESTTDGYSANYINQYTQDTGWLEPTMESGFTTGALSSSGNLMYKRIGKEVYIKGSVKGFTATSQACCQLPSGYRPATRIDCSLGTGGNYFARGMISSGGNITLLGDTRTSLSADNWYSICTSYITDDDFPSS